jgi:hypothetical protein
MEFERSQLARLKLTERALDHRRSIDCKAFWELIMDYGFVSCLETSDGMNGINADRQSIAVSIYLTESFRNDISCS